MAEALQLTEVERQLLASLTLGYNITQTAERVGRMLGTPLNVTKVHSHLRKARRRGDYATLYQLVAEFASRTKADSKPKGEVLIIAPPVNGRPRGKRSKT